MQNLATAFEAANPNVTVSLVSQPGDNYFALLKAAAISKTGPDLAVQWTGLFTLQNKSYLQNLKGLIPDARPGARIDPDALVDEQLRRQRPVRDRSRISSTWASTTREEAFSKAGGVDVPATWNDLFAACTRS